MAEYLNSLTADQVQPFAILFAFVSTGLWIYSWWGHSEPLHALIKFALSGAVILAVIVALAANGVLGVIAALIVLILHARSNPVDEPRKGNK